MAFLLPHTTKTDSNQKNNTVLLAGAEGEIDVNHPAFTTHECTTSLSFAKVLGSISVYINLTEMLRVSNNIDSHLAKENVSTCKYMHLEHIYIHTDYSPGFPFTLSKY